MTNEPKSGYAEIKDIRLYYETDGEGPDLVFCTCGLCRSQNVGRTILRLRTALLSRHAL